MCFCCSAGVNATVTFKGRIPLHGNITNGRVELNLWEYGVQAKVYHTNILYFNCDPHGCYANQPISLFLGAPCGLLAETPMHHCVVIMILWTFRQSDFTIRVQGHM